MLDADLVASIDEAAIVPENWPRVLAELARIGDGAAAGLIAFDPAGQCRYTTTPSYEAAFAAFAAEGLQLDNLRPRRALASRHAGFLSDLEVCTEAELAVDQIYARFLRPNGFGWTCGSVIPVPTGDLIVFDVGRSLSQTPFERRDNERLDVYRPHLARAALLASRLGLREARAAAEAMELIGLPAAVITGSGRLLASNTGFEALSPRVGSRARDQIRLADADADRRLGAAIAAITAGAAGEPRSVPMPSSNDSPALIAHLVPIRHKARDVFAAGAALVVITEVTAPRAPLTELLSGLFDLTPAESRLARAVADGSALGEIAMTGQISVETLRSQLKSVMAKTGTRRQVDLVRLLLGSGAPGRPSPPS